MANSEVNWWAGRGPTNPNSEVPQANQIPIEEQTPQEKKAGDNFFDGLDFVVEHPQFDIRFDPEADLSDRDHLYATFKGDMSLPDEKGEKSRVYMIWERGTDKPIAVTKTPSRYTDELRNIS